MRTEDFWAMVQRMRHDLRDEAPALAALTMELQRLGEPEISAFERHMREEIALLDTLALRDVATQLWVLSDEAWLHFRAWCVSRGQEFVTQLLAAPGRTLRAVAEDTAGPFDPPNGELFVYCAEYARVSRAKAVA